MQVSSVIHQSVDAAKSQVASLKATESFNQLNHVADSSQGGQELEDAFDDFVGQTFFSHLIKTMRSSVGKPAYFHGGRTEEIFQAQLDQKFTEEISKASAKDFSEPMFELFMARRP